jgi:hypothetical protein
MTEATEVQGTPEARKPTFPEISKAVGPQKNTRALLILFLIGICSRGYGYYNQQWKADPSLWTSVLRGKSAAPEQYRVGVVMTANWMGQIFHLRLSQAFGVLDLLGSVLAVLLLYGILLRTRTFREASLPVQWFGSATFLALTIYYVDWTSWYQKVATLPTAGLVAVMLWMWTPNPGARPSGARQALLAAGFFLIAMAQAFVRADVALLVCVGIFIASLMRIGGELALPRYAALATSLIAAMAVAGVQLYLMRIRYPNAGYDGVPVFMLKHDFKKVFMWASCLIFLAPFLWTAVQARRRRFAGEGAGAGFLIAAVGYLGLWLVLGRLDEVRIFIPMALVNLPLTAELAMRKVGALEHS